MNRILDLKPHYLRPWIGFNGMYVAIVENLVADGVDVTWKLK